MKYTYFPGCTSHSTGRELDESLRDVCRALGIEITDLDDWNCCGSSSAHVKDHFLEIALPARNLELAEQKGDDVIVGCAACFNRLRGALKAAREGTLPADAPQARGTVDVVNLIDVLAREEILDQLKKSGGSVLKGMKVAAYYGCLSLRPGDVTGVPDIENPQSMEKIAAALGAEPVDWSLKAQCCGAAMNMTDENVVFSLTGKLFDQVDAVGAEIIVTGCPMCFMSLERTSLERSAKGKSVKPVYYITELIMLALDKAAAPKYLKRHLVESQQYLRERGLL